MSANNSRQSPRQKMINLMYIVFLAMVALNVSSDVLAGFKHVEDALSSSNSGVTVRNNKLYQTFDEALEKNPEKVARWHQAAALVRQETAHLNAFIDSLKLEIVRFADGDKADPNHIRNRENLEAVNQIMLSPLYGGGEKLRLQLDTLNAHFAAMLPADDARTVDSYLSTKTAESGALNWEGSLFENIPVAAAVTILTKIQGDVLQAEGHTVESLMQSIDRGDMRVNQMQAFVIPNARNVMRGSVYEARIVMAAVDTTQTPQIFIGDKAYNPARQGYYAATATREGMQVLKGHLEVNRPDGTVEQLPFESSYFVSEPMATVSNTMMNVMYAGIDNPLSISVPGVSSTHVTATMSNGTLARAEGGWKARPAKVGEDAIITVSANEGGHARTVSQTAFHVRRLPDPTPYLLCHDAAGNTVRYKGGSPISKQALLAAGGIKAAIDDGLLNVEFTVKSFRIDIFDSMGNDIPEDSPSASYSERQRTAIGRLSRGKKFFITRVKAIGPDGIERTLSPIEVVVN